LYGNIGTATHQLATDSIYNAEYFIYKLIFVFYYHYFAHICIMTNSVAKAAEQLLIATRAKRTDAWVHDIIGISFEEFSDAPVPDSPAPTNCTDLSNLSAEIIQQQKRRRALQRIAQPAAPKTPRTQRSQRAKTARQMVRPQKPAQLSAVENPFTQHSLRAKPMKRVDPAVAPQREQKLRTAKTIARLVIEDCATLC
jgi:hypothetical protein